MGNKKKREELTLRWDNFLVKITSRSDELLEQANQGTDMFIPQLQFDTNAVGNAWTGIKNQIDELVEKLEEGWNKMDELFDKTGCSENQTEEQRTKKEETDIFINLQYERNKTLALAKAAKQVFSNINCHINKNKIHQCTQCGSDLSINIYTFRSKNVKCESCGSVNTYEPDGKILALETWVVGALAEEYVINEKEKEFYAEEVISFASHGEVSQEQKNQLIDLRKERINKFYNFLIDSIPEKSEIYIRQRDERLKWAEIVRV